MKNGTSLGGKDKQGMTFCTMSVFDSSIVSVDESRKFLAIVMRTYNGQRCQDEMSIAEKDQEMTKTINYTHVFNMICLSARVAVLIWQQVQAVKTIMIELHLLAC